MGCNVCSWSRVCSFTYAYSRFQGEGSAKDICDALQSALDAWDTAAAGPPDAIVIIRGGAVNDIAWLNHYDLARFICDLPIPVFTGIGHERDTSVLDEVANIRFDTPSKVIAGIEQVIAKRAAQAKANYEEVSNLAARVLQSVKATTGALEMTVRGEALRHLAQGKQSTATLLSDIRLDTMQVVRSAAEQSIETLQMVKTEALVQLADAKRDVPAFWGHITLGTTRALRTASRDGVTLVASVLERAQRDALRAKHATEDAMVGVGTSAKLHIREGATRAEALMREIAGQGPEKTLSRGFAIVRTQGGEPLTRATQVFDDAEIEIQFQDGRVTATAGKHN